MLWDLLYWIILEIIIEFYVDVGCMLPSMPLLFPFVQTVRIPSDDFEVSLSINTLALVDILNTHNIISNWSSLSGGYMILTK